MSSVANEVDQSYATASQCDIGFGRQGTSSCVDDMIDKGLSMFIEAKQGRSLGMHSSYLLIICRGMGPSIVIDNIFTNACAKPAM
jgi:hypothetical protein